MSGEAIEVDDMLCADLDTAILKNIEARRNQRMHMARFSGDLRKLQLELKSRNGRNNGGKANEPDNGNTSQPTD